MIDTSDILKDPDDIGAIVHLTCEYFSLLLKNNRFWKKQWATTNSAKKYSNIVADMLPLLDYGGKLRLMMIKLLIPHNEKLVFDSRSC